jgi:cell division protein FtsW
MATRTPRPNNVAKPRAGRVKEIILSPRTSFLDWYDGYFRNQTKEFRYLVRLIVFIVSFGVVMVLSSSNVDSIISSGDPFRSFAGQFIIAIAGMILMFWISNRNVEQIERLGLLLFLGSLAAQFLLLIPGVGRSAGGNQNWISFFGVTVQPSEFLKLGLVIFLATFLSKNIDNLWDWRSGGLQILIAGFGSAGLVLAIGSDFGTAAVIMLIVFALAFLAGLPGNHLNKLVIIAVVVGLAASLATPSRVARLLAFLNFGDTSDAGANWQVSHGIWALASGGFFGTGLGQAKLNWGWVPEVENDFIFTSIGEEWGFLGAVFVLFLFLALFLMLRRIANESNDPFVSLTTIGIMIWITLQALINIAVVLDLFPTLGVPLPFISKGGSSLLAVLMGMGVVLSFARNQAPAPVRKRR